MGDRSNRKIVLAQRPAGVPRASDFRLEEEAVAAPGDGEVLVATTFLKLFEGGHIGKLLLVP